MLDEQKINDAYEMLKRKRKDEKGYLSETNERFRKIGKKHVYGIAGLTLGCALTAGVIFGFTYMRSEGMLEQTKTEAKAIAVDIVKKTVPDAIYGTIDEMVDARTEEKISEHKKEYHTPNENTPKIMSMNPGPATVYREKVIVKRDTVYAYREKEMPEKSQITSAAPDYVDKASRIFSMENSIDNIIYVDKSSNTTRLIQKDGKVFSYNSTDGKNTGAKEYKGDLRTPEGIYNINAPFFFDNSNYDPIYGAAKINIGYPSSIDIRDGRTGSGILICGTGFQERLDAIACKKDITNGAVVMDDKSMWELASKVDGNYRNTIVVIEDKKRPVDINDYSEVIRR